MTKTSQGAEVSVTFPVLGKFITEYFILFSERNLRSLRDGQFRCLFFNLPSQSIFRNIEFSDSIHRPGIKKQTKGNTTFRTSPVIGASSF
jgi:hypothetical protein